MKVIQILPELHSGGVERGTLEVAQYLVEQGHESVIISNGGRLVAQLEQSGLRHIQLPVHRKSPMSLLQIAPLRRILASEKPDILHARSRVPAWLSHFALKKISAKTRPHFVTTVHGAHSVSAYSAIMTRGERVIAVSNFICEYVVKNYPKTPVENIRVVHRGVSPEEFPRGFQPATEWREKWEIAFPQFKGKRVLTLVGRMTRLKGHEMFIRMVHEVSKQNPDIVGLIVGGVDQRDAYAEEMQNLASSLNISEKIVFAGHRSDIREIYASSAIVFSLSTKSESFGRTVLEPLSMGVPAIGYDRGGVGEILRELFPQGAVTPDDLDALVKRTSELLNSPRRDIPEKRTFLLSAMLENTLNVYQELIECGPRSS